MIVFYFLLNMASAVLAVIVYEVSLVKEHAGRTGERNKIISAICSAAKKYGITKKSDIILYAIMPFTGILFCAAALFYGKAAASVLLLTTPVFVELILLTAKKKNAASVFQKNAYKLYKYILNQSAAGVRPSDAMKKMYEVVEEKTLRLTIMEACAKYSVSLDTDILSEEILNNIDTPEARSFALTIRDKIFESHEPELVERLEQLMFNRYFAYVQRATDSVKTRCLITVVLLCSVIVVMVLIPTFLDVQNALNSIFTQ